MPAHSITSYQQSELNCCCNFLSGTNNNNFNWCLHNKRAAAAIMTSEGFVGRLSNTNHNINDKLQLSKKQTKKSWDTHCCQ